MFKLCWIAFGRYEKHLRIGLLLIHKNGWGAGGGADFCDGAKLQPGSDL